MPQMAREMLGHDRLGQPQTQFEPDPADLRALLDLPDPIEPAITRLPQLQGG